MAGMPNSHISAAHSERHGSRWGTVRTFLRRQIGMWGCLLALLVPGVPAIAQSGGSNRPLQLSVPDAVTAGPERWTSPEGLSSTLQVMLLLTVLSLAPAVILMTTSFIRVVVVLGLLRQAAELAAKALRG